ncbi:MAG: hypothetical protein HPY44_08090 [Armatimonadetes bacterium]|nr:hypothetical protein [Armatimonadota bacterium]
MERKALPLVMCFVLAICGCPPDVPQTEGRTVGAPGVPAGPTASSQPDGDETVYQLDAVDSAGDLPPCTAEDFGTEGTTAVFTKYADLDGDGVLDAIMGYRASQTDELDEPVSPAFVELARWTGQEWEEWFGIPAPGGETMLDADSLVVAGDMNDDGIPELGIQFYGFGVSSRPETLYLWQVVDDGLEPGIEGEALDTTSDAGMLIQDVVDYYPGVELVLAEPIMGNEAHAAPHKYSIRLFGSEDGIYRQLQEFRADGLFGSPFDAIQHHIDDLSSGR